MNVKRILNVLENVINSLANVLSALLSILNVIVGTLLKPIVWVAKFLNFLHKKWISYKLKKYQQKADEELNQFAKNVDDILEVVELD